MGWEVLRYVSTLSTVTIRIGAQVMFAETRHIFRFSRLSLITSIYHWEYCLPEQLKNRLQRSAI